MLCTAAMRCLQFKPCMCPPAAAYDREGNEVASSTDKDFVTDYFIMEKVRTRVMGTRVPALFLHAPAQSDACSHGACDMPRLWDERRLLRCCPQLTQMPSYIYRGWRFVATYVQEEQGAGRGDDRPFLRLGDGDDGASPESAGYGAGKGAPADGVEGPKQSPMGA